MEFSNFPNGEEYLDQYQYHKPHEVCCCKSVNNLMEMIQDLKSSLRSSIREEVEEVARRVILPYLSASTNSTPPPLSRSLPDCLPHPTGPPTSRRLYLRINDTSLPDTLYTMTKIQCQPDSLSVELVDDLGRRVENEPESSAKIRLVVLNGDFEAEGNDWSEECFNKNRVQPRKDKASSLLKGKCEILLSRGVANVGDLSFTDNSKRTETFRLGAEVITNSRGVGVKAAVSKPFTVKERRLLTDRKHEKPSPEDELWRLKNIRRDGPVYVRAQKANICTVKDFLQLLHTDRKRLQNILGVPEAKWYEIVKNAETCVLNNDTYRYYDDATGVEMLLDCAFNIIGATFTNQISQSYGSLNDVQKQVVNEARVAAYENRSELKPYTPMNLMQSHDDLPFVHMNYHQATSIQIQGPVACAPSISSMSMHSDATLLDQGESVLRACSYSHGLPSCHSDHEKPQSEMSERQLPDDPILDQEWDQLLAGWEIDSNPTRKLIAACYVTKAATMFMVGFKQDSSPPKRKRISY